MIACSTSFPRRPPKGNKKRGRARKYGAEFRFAAPARWPVPDEVLEFEDPQFGRTCLELWSALCFRVKKEIVDIAVVRARIRLEKDSPPAPHWYGVHNGTKEKTTLARVFECITSRWPIEPANRFRKERLYAELPKVRQAKGSDLWMTLLQIVEWELYLWRPAATDAHLPWQKPLAPDQFTPGRVIRSCEENPRVTALEVPAPQAPMKSHNICYQTYYTYLTIGGFQRTFLSVTVICSLTEYN